MADAKAGETVYECHNPACALGSRKDPGRFTGGITQEMAVAITADDDAKFGDGYCPNCGEKAQKAKEAN